MRGADVGGSLELLQKISLLGRRAYTFGYPCLPPPLQGIEILRMSCFEQAARCRFITEQLIGPPEAERTAEGESAAAPAKRRRARYVLEDGILEVDGKPRDGVPRPAERDWYRDELKGNVTDLPRGQR